MRTSADNQNERNRRPAGGEVGKGQSKGEQTRRAIVSGALSLVSEVGYEGLSIGVLAKEVKLSKSGLFAHFKSKEALQLGVIQEVVNRITLSVVQPALAAPRGEYAVKLDCAAACCRRPRSSITTARGTRCVSAWCMRFKIGGSWWRGAPRPQSTKAIFGAIWILSSLPTNSTASQ